MKCSHPLAAAALPELASVPQATVPSKSNGSQRYLLIAGGALFFLILIIGGVIATQKMFRRGKGTNQVTSVSISPKPTRTKDGFKIKPTVTQAPNQNPAFAKYFTDSDGDHIANFIELKMGTDPNQNDCVKAAGCVNQNVLFILDSSGSMALQSGGKQKIATAKRALKNHLTQLNPNINVGLMVYGYKGSNKAADKAISCAGIKMAYPLRKVNKTIFNKAIDSFSAAGWTPIADSLIKAKNEVFANKGHSRNLIVLLSDGVETCEGNPVAVTKQIKASKIAAINVIGFGVDAKTELQLEQIAAAGGGQYYGATDFTELNNVLNESTEEWINSPANMLCKDANWAQYSTCLNNVSIQYTAWSNHKFDQLMTDPTTQDEAGFLLNEYNSKVKTYINQQQSNALQKSKNALK